MLSIKLFFFIMISLYLSNAKSIDTTTSKKISKDGRCGKEFGHCREGYCCSKIGWCGDSDLHCNIEEGCQSEFGKWHGIELKDEKIPIKDNNESSEEEEEKKDIIHGKCGKGYGSCKEGYCCSKYGWCGKSDAYCDTSKGCQSEFGICKSKPIEDENESSDEELPISKDGRCGKGVALCGEGYCCSAYGWCGKDDLYCQKEKGCQIKYGECSSSNQIVNEKEKDKLIKDNGEASEEELPISKDGRCGKGIAICGDGNCCSSFGWCGNTKDHCKIDRGCQTDFGECYSNKSNENVTKINIKNENNKSTQNNQNSNNKLPISKDGRCGKDVAICNEGFCCSMYGWCGKTDKYCKIEEGCQKEFGVCNSNKNTDNKIGDNEFNGVELPISKDGRCGEGIAICGEDSCCSNFGWCGKTKDHCMIDRGCQTEFGICYSNNVMINETKIDNKNNNNKDRVIIIGDDIESSDEEDPTNEPTNEISEEETFDPLNNDNIFS